MGHPSYRMNFPAEALTFRVLLVDIKPTPTVTAEEILALRERLNLSRAVFARALRTNVRTVENWEQGRAWPNVQAAS